MKAASSIFCKGMERRRRSVERLNRTELHSVSGQLISCLKKAFGSHSRAMPLKADVAPPRKHDPMTEKVIIPVLVPRSRPP
jgi:hypothetical protein